MLQFDLDSLDTARVGRMGELVVELQLLARGWLVGNFNATTANSAGWDLFAVRGDRTLKVRVKAKRPGVSAFVWSLKASGSVFAHLDPADEDDVVAAVSFTASGEPSVYVVPTPAVERALLADRAAWLAAPKKRGAGAKVEPNALRLHLDHRPDLGPGHGYADLWGPYRGAWAPWEG